MCVLALLAGCASPQVEADIKKLKQKISELTQKEEDSQNQIEELSARLFLLEDKVDTERVQRESSGKAPRLPVIRIKPQQGARQKWQEEHTRLAENNEPREAVNREPPISSGGASVVESKTVIYDGKAKQNGPRPVLRLHGASTLRTHRLSSSNMPPLEVKERLPVMPIPRKKEAAQIAGADQGVLYEYQQARKLYTGGKYPEAVKAFTSFIQRHQKHQLTDNALYWLGECYYDTRDYQRALGSFRRTVEEHPSGNKAPDALYKMALCYKQMNEKKNARSVLTQVIESYPKSRVSQIATATLNKLQ